MNYSERLPEHGAAFEQGKLDKMWGQDPTGWGKTEIIVLDHYYLSV